MPTILVVDTVADLEALTPPDLNDVAYLKEAGREGMFKNEESTAVRNRGTIFYAGDTDGTNNRRWIRDISPGGPYHVDWFREPLDTDDTKSFWGDQAQGEPKQDGVIDAAGDNGTIVMTPGTVYETHGAVRLRTGQTLVGYGATLKRMAEVTDTVTAQVHLDASAKPTKTIQVANASKFQVGWQITLTDSTRPESDSNAKLRNYRIRAIDDNTLTISPRINNNDQTPFYPANSTVYTSFNQIEVPATGTADNHILGLELDGNRNPPAPAAARTRKRWELHNSINLKSLRGVVRDCRIRESQGDGIMVGGKNDDQADDQYCVIDNNTIEYCDGNGIHFSGGDNVRISNNRVVHTNQEDEVGGLDVGHVGGCIEFSQMCRHVVLIGNYLEDGKYGIAGFDHFDATSFTVSHNVIKECRDGIFDACMKTHHAEPLRGELVFANNRCYGKVDMLQDLCLETAQPDNLYSLQINDNYLKRCGLKLKNARDVQVTDNVWEIINEPATNPSGNLITPVNITAFALEQPDLVVVDKCQNVQFQNNTCLGPGGSLARILFKSAKGNPSMSIMAIHIGDGTVGQCAFKVTANLTADSTADSTGDLIVQGSDYLQDGGILIVCHSTGNDGTYTIRSGSSYDGIAGQTTINVEEAIPNGTIVDGRLTIVGVDFDIVKLDSSEGSLTVRGNITDDEDANILSYDLIQKGMLIATGTANDNRTHIIASERPGTTTNPPEPPWIGSDATNETTLYMSTAIIDTINGQGSLGKLGFVGQELALPIISLDAAGTGLVVQGNVTSYVTKGSQLSVTDMAENATQYTVTQVNYVDENPDLPSLGDQTTITVEEVITSEAGHTVHFVGKNHTLQIKDNSFRQCKLILADARDADVSGNEWHVVDDTDLPDLSPTVLVYNSKQVRIADRVFGGGGIVIKGPDSQDVGNRAPLIQGLDGASGYQLDSGGRPRGVNAVDLQTSRAKDSQVAKGHFSFIAGGEKNKAQGSHSHVQGLMTTAPGKRAHAEGKGTTASGIEAHAEGRATVAQGVDSHAEGRASRATGYVSHAEGRSAQAGGSMSHAEGRFTEAFGNSSHAEGHRSRALEYASHAGGRESMAYLQGQWARSSSSFSPKERGAAQTTITQLFQESVEVVPGEPVEPVELTLNGQAAGGSNRFKLRDDQTLSCFINIVARAGGTDVLPTTQHASFLRHVLIHREGTITTMMGVHPIGTDFNPFTPGDPDEWTIDISAESDSLTIKATADGNAGTVRWMATVIASEVLAEPAPGI
jgi:parallel beta-helix repeat protein